MQDSPCRARLGLLLLAATLLGAQRASAHVVLLAPNGGETLYAGSTFTIRWKILVPHNLQDWDLWYSTTGAGGPWIPIAMNLPSPSTSYEWTVPATYSTQVRVRVRMDNYGYDYYDISDNDLTIAPSLTVDTPSLSLSAGGTQTMSLSAGSANAGAVYGVLGTVSGTSPGFTFNGVTIPLNVDSYFLFTLVSPNLPPLSTSVGVLDANGNGTARFTLPPGLPVGLKALTFHHAFVLLDLPTNTTITMASNPESLSLLP